MTLRQKDQLAPVYADLVYNGQWFSPLKSALDAFVDKTQEVVTGEVKVKLYKGQATAVARKSDYSLYREDLATFGQDDVYHQADSEGFIRLFGLPTKVAAARDRMAKSNKAEASR